jgi:hypothetical protein
MDAPERTRRPWLTHERSVLLISAIIAALALSWLGWQAHIVQHRRAMRAQIEAGGGEVALYIINVGSVSMASEIRSAETANGVPWLRRLLGDQDASLVSFQRQLTTADREAIEAFPEATVFGIPETSAPADAP